jgi:hypothetical protein
VISPEELAHHLDDPAWRLSHLYKIIVKGRTVNDDLIVGFTPNRAQQALIDRMWYRNIILKARQLGFSTLICILWLDTALFSKSPVRCGIIADNRDNAENLFRDKVKFAYDHLPEVLRRAFPLARDSANELRFTHNGASIRVATSMRGGTIHRLHVSEFGNMCAHYPDKAQEVVTGSIPAVPSSGILIIESTAKGREGNFYRMTQRAMALRDAGKELSVKDFRFHFFPWHEEPEYEIDPATATHTERTDRYFEEVEAVIGKPLSERKRAWYLATMAADFSENEEMMRQEYPGTPEEAFQVSTEGCFYARQITAARKEGRILRIPRLPEPVNTFWDIGHSGQSDASGIWFHQKVAMENRFIRYIEWDSGETLQEYIRYLQNTGYVFGAHYLPHDAEHKRLGVEPDRNRSIKEMLASLFPGQRFVTVPRITEILTGIQAVRNVFPSCYFDEEGCAEGLRHLENYRKDWDEKHGCWLGTPRHDEHSHAADAFRTFGQEADNGNLFLPGYSHTERKKFRASRAQARDWRT